MELLNELFPLEWMAIRFIQLTPLMLVFGFLGHTLDMDNKRFKDKEKEKDKKEKLRKYYGQKKKE